MSRRSLSNVLSHRELSLLEVWGWYEFQRALIGEEKSRVSDVLDRGVRLAAPRYFGRTREELEHLLAFQEEELFQMTMLGMLAATEAALRIDFIERVKNRKKDVVSRDFRDAYKHKRKFTRIRLEEDILDTWKKRGANAGVRSAVAQFKGALNLRHWLAHGRYWEPKLGRRDGYLPGQVFDICKALLQATGLVPPDPTAA